MNRKSRSFFNSVAITYLIITTVALLILAAMDPRLPLGFLYAMVSPKFWRLAGEGFQVFMSIGIVSHFFLYSLACYRKGSTSRLIQTILAVVLNAGFYFSVFAVFMLSGLRH